MTSDISTNLDVDLIAAETLGYQGTILQAEARKKQRQKIVAGAIAAALVCGGAGFGFGRGTQPAGASEIAVSASVPDVVDAIDIMEPEVAEPEPEPIPAFDADLVQNFALDSFSYRYTKTAVDDDDSSILPGLRRTIAIEYQAQIDFAVDSSKIQVDQNDDSVIITIPKADDVYHEPISGSFKTLVDRSGIWRNDPAPDDHDLFVKYQAEMLQQAVVNGIADAAQAQAYHQIRSFLDSRSDLSIYRFTVRLA